MDDLPHLLPDLDYLLNFFLHLSELLIAFIHDLLKFLVRTKELYGVFFVLEEGQRVEFIRKQLIKSPDHLIVLLLLQGDCLEHLLALLKKLPAFCR